MNTTHVGHYNINFLYVDTLLSSEIFSKKQNKFFFLATLLHAISEKG